METKIIDINGLSFFKQQQNMRNDAVYMNIAEFTDENGIILSEKLPGGTSAPIATLAEIGALFTVSDDDEQG